MKASIAVLPGDGIGPEVINESIKILEAVGNRFGHDFQIESGRVDSTCWKFNCCSGAERELSNVILEM